MSQQRRTSAHQQKQRQRNVRYIVVSIVGVLLIGGAYLFNANGGFGGGMTFRDIHGMSYTPDGTLHVATHDGLRVYADATWTAPEIPANDYMGYSGTQEGFYSSGHPGAGSSLTNPLGLVRSDDNGATLQTIAFSGETDFHVMGAAYRNSEVVYVFAPQANSQLSAGLHYSVDGGNTWNAAPAQGLSSQPIALAVHPTQENIVAIAAGTGGTLLSTDYGATFTRISNAPGVAVAFDVQDEDTLYFGYQTLSRYSLAEGSIRDISIPAISEDAALLYIATDPTSDAIAIATSEWDVYRWDGETGSQWQRLVDEGRTL